MNVEKLRNLTDAELLHQQRELNDQLFRMKFQLKMGQTESLNKIRGLRKDVARIQTVMREKQLGVVHVAAAEPAAAAPKGTKGAKKSHSAKKTKSVKKARTRTKR